MEEVSRLRVAFNCVNDIRTLPVYLSILSSPHRTLIEKSDIPAKVLRLRTPEEIEAGSVDTR